MTKNRIFCYFFKKKKKKRGKKHIVIFVHSSHIKFSSFFSPLLPLSSLSPFHFRVMVTSVWHADRHSHLMFSGLQNKSSTNELPPFFFIGKMSFSQSLVWTCQFDLCVLLALLKNLFFSLFDNIFFYRSVIGDVIDQDRISVPQLWDIFFKRNFFYFFNFKVIVFWTQASYGQKLFLSQPSPPSPGRRSPLKFSPFFFRRTITIRHHASKTS